MSLSKSASDLPPSCTEEKEIKEKEKLLKVAQEQKEVIASLLTIIESLKKRLDHLKRLDTMQESIREELTKLKEYEETEWTENMKAVFLSKMEDLNELREEIFREIERIPIRNL